ncbi:MAG: wobble nucleotide-excising tRNase [Marinomonas primoryensis]|jgi:wobble nucleotide-excising tRNase
MSQSLRFDSLEGLVSSLREKLEEKGYLLLFAYNGTGKTRLSMAFKEAGKTDDNADTLYFNAFTEDLFSWDNDLDNDTQRVLKVNKDSRFFEGLQELEMENRIRPLLQRYADFDFIIDYINWTVNFIREDKSVSPTQKIEHIKVSRGEENIFVWCFFLAIAQLAIDSKEDEEAYSWVKYLYIDDPISSLDDNNAIAVASHLSQLLKSDNGKIKAIISTHHTLFFNVMWNELTEKRKLQPYFLSADPETNAYSLRYTNDTPFFHHIALLKQLHEAAMSGKLYTYHFNVLRNILEKTATFHGFKNFSACIKKDSNDPEGIVHARMVNVLSHGNYSLFEPTEMLPENKEYFKKILSGFMQDYRFDPALFPEQEELEKQNLDEAPKP